MVNSLRSGSAMHMLVHRVHVLLECTYARPQTLSYAITRAERLSDSLIAFRLHGAQQSEEGIRAP